jgi:WD40 repeat protein
LEDDADALLLGHGSNVCALDASADGKLIISGSWDTDARVWQVGKWGEESTLLKGHEASVWAVLSYDESTIITGTPEIPLAYLVALWWACMLIQTCRLRRQEHPLV